VVRYPSCRWLTSLLALVMAAGISAVAVLRAQDRAGTGAPARHWWNTSSPSPAAAPQNPRQPAATPTTTLTAASGTTIYRLVRNLRGESKPLIVDADEIATWTEKVGATEYCVFLFRGLGLVQQGIVQARFEQGVAWIDMRSYKTTGKLRTEFYAEGKVRIDDGSVIRDYPRAILDLTTRGELKVNAHRVPLVRQSRAEDPLVQRGRAEGLGPRLLQTRNSGTNAGPSPLQRASFQQMRQLILPPTVQPGGKPAPAPSPNLQPAPPLPRPPMSTPPVSNSNANTDTLERVSHYGPPADTPESSGSVAAPADRNRPRPTGPPMFRRARRTVPCRLPDQHAYRQARLPYRRRRGRHRLLPENRSRSRRISSSRRGKEARASTAKNISAATARRPSS